VSQDGNKTRPRPNYWLGGVALALLAGLITALAWGIWRVLTSLDSGTAAAVITASATVLISVLSLIFSRRSEQQRAIEQAHRDRKVPIYDEFMGFWFRMLGAEQRGEDPPSEQEIARFLYDFTQKVTLWGPDPFIAQYNDFRRTSLSAGPEEDESSPAVMFAFEDLMFAMRKDLGHPNAVLGEVTC
jgi:hypothetical protein